MERSLSTFAEEMSSSAMIIGKQILGDEFSVSDMTTKGCLPQTPWSLLMNWDEELHLVKDLVFHMLLQNVSSK